MNGKILENVYYIFKCCFRNYVSSYSLIFVLLYFLVLVSFLNYNLGFSLSKNPYLVFFLFFFFPFCSLSSSFILLKLAINIITYFFIPATHQDAVLAVLPFFHIYAATVIMFHKLSLGIKLVTLSKLQPDHYFETLEKFRTNLLFVAPPLGKC